MKKKHTGLLLSLSLSFLAHGQDVKKATIHEFGIYGEAKQERIAYPNAPNGYVLKGYTETLLSQTNVIPATVGTKFGFRYSLEPKANAEQAKIKIVYIFPEIKNPKIGESYTRHVGRALYTFGAPSTYVIYNLEEEWEAAPGKWTLQIWEGDTKLAEKTFQLVKQ